MCPSVSSVEATAINEHGLHDKRIFSGWHVECPISWYLENSEFQIMNHLNPGFRIPFLRVRVTSTEYRRRAVPGMGPSTNAGEVSEVSLDSQITRTKEFTHVILAIIVKHQQYQLLVQFVQFERDWELERRWSKQGNHGSTSRWTQC